MKITNATYARIQETIDDPPVPVPPHHNDPICRANIDNLLKREDPFQIQLPWAKRPLSLFEQKHLVGSLPVLGMPFYRMITQEGLYERRVYSFKRMTVLKCQPEKRSARANLIVNSGSAGSKTSLRTQIYYKPVGCGVWVSSDEIAKGRFPRFLVGHIVGSDEWVETVNRELDVAAGGRERWRSMEDIKYSGYAMTDQARIYRIKEYSNGRTSNPHTGEEMPYEVVPQLVDGKYPQVLLVRDEPYGSQARPKWTLRVLYEQVWPDTTPQMEADRHGTTGYNPQFDVKEYFKSTEAKITEAAEAAEAQSKKKKP
jgi:hypothetical protein